PAPPPLRRRFSFLRLSFLRLHGPEARRGTSPSPALAVAPRSPHCPGATLLLSPGAALKTCSKQRRSPETTAERQRVGRDNGGVPGPRCAQHSSFGAAPSFRLRPRRCAVVSALRRGLECPFATGCGSAATITVTPAPAAAARRPNVASHLAVTTDDHGAPGVGLSSLLVPVLAQQLLVELAHRGARHLVDDIDFVGHLPLGE